MKEPQDGMKRLVASLFFSYFFTVLSIYLSLSFHGYFRSIAYNPLLSFMLYPVIVPGMICFCLTLNLNDSSKPWMNFAIFFSHLFFLVAIFMVMFLTGGYFSIQQKLLFVPGGTVEPPVEKTSGQSDAPQTLPEPACITQFPSYSGEITEHFCQCKCFTSNGRLQFQFEAHDETNSEDGIEFG